MSMTGDDKTPPAPRPAIDRPPEPDHGATPAPPAEPDADHGAGGDPLIEGP